MIDELKEEIENTSWFLKGKLLKGKEAFDYLNEINDIYTSLLDDARQLSSNIDRIVYMSAGGCLKSEVMNNGEFLSRIKLLCEIFLEELNEYNAHYPNQRV